ncbi:unnamed protein product [Soboliphyme baturini]|uniref:Xenotropic and polytropic retrovirus receptor 1 n=1 Tax=Soboliphyme baturini TaxID=241478 RepID=A0A183J0H0_9BILA|nr:unnamed protein product [Soboliphyme baturini]
MKFGEHLSSHLTPEWRKQYIQYEAMKVMVYEILQSVPSTEQDRQRRERIIVQRDEAFFKFCAEEFDKINLFFNRKIAEAHEQYRELTCELAQTLEKSKANLRRMQPSPSLKKKLLNMMSIRVMAVPDEIGSQSPRKTISELKNAFSEFYLSLVLLQNYQQLNTTGFRKILKKHDKVLQTTKGSEWRMAHVDNSSFVLHNEIDKLIELTENAFTTGLEKGDRQAAMKRLRVAPFSEKQQPWTTFLLGFYLGIFVVLLCLAVLTIALILHVDEPRWVAVRMFRGFLILFVNIFLIGVNMYGWQRHGVNHVLIFEVDPRRHLTYQRLLEISSMFLVMWMMCVLGFLYAGHMNLSPLIFPLILMLFLVTWTLNPFDVCSRSSRYWLLRHLYNCFTSPFHKVTFADFWLGDQMNSLVTLFLDFQYFFCFYSCEVDYTHGMQIIFLHDENSTVGNLTRSRELAWGVHPSNYLLDTCSSSAYGIRPIISLLPALIRFLQCLRRYSDSKSFFPHLVNAGKYSTTLFVVIFGALNTSHKQNKYHLSSGNTFGPCFFLWIIANVVSFGYTYVWDIKMDWGLLDRNCGNNKYLREELVYNRKWYYYLAIVIDFFLRITWVLNVSLGDAWLTEADVLLSVTAPLECFRRFIWNFFRLENEHLNNCGQFRAVRDISLHPLNKGDVDELENMVDEEEGVSHRDSDFQAILSKKAKSKFKPNFRRRIVSKLGIKNTLIKCKSDPDHSYSSGSGGSFSAVINDGNVNVCL